MSETTKRSKTAATGAATAAATGVATSAVAGAAAGAGAATAATSGGGSGPSPMRRFFELIFMLVSAILVIFSWDTAVKKTEENESLRAELRRTKQSNGDVDRSGTRCTVCLDNPREVLIKDCGHVCVCADCAERIRHETNRCPVCRKEIQGTQSVYIS